MDREIKFRAWDRERSMFVPQGEIVFSDYGDTEWRVVPNCMEYIHDQVHHGEPQRGRFVISQFTGLKDCKGVDIYEGDILSDESQMQWCNTCVGFQPHWMMTELICHFCDGNYSIREMDFTKISIIGNIYENPELIEG